MTVRKFRKSDDRNIKMRPYDRSKHTPRHGSNGLLPSPMYVSLYDAPATPEDTGR